jgi:hypothetical protein
MDKRLAAHHFFGLSRPLPVVVDPSKSPQPLMRQWFPVDSQVLLQDIHIQLTQL